MPASNADRPDAGLFASLSDGQIELLCASLDKAARRESLHGNHGLAADLHEVWEDLDGGFWKKRGYGQ